MAVEKKGASVALACRAFDISEGCYRYEPILSDENAFIADWLISLTQARKNWGFGLCFLYLRNVKGYRWNHKRVEVVLVIRPVCSLVKMDQGFI